MTLDLIRLREALEASWDSKTSYLAQSKEGNPALGQCYPTARVVQFFLPETEIVEGEVWTGATTEKHFWNILHVPGTTHHIDFTWRQFPHGSVIKTWKIRDRHTLGDTQPTLHRVDLLHQRVRDYLARLEA